MATNPFEKYLANNLADFAGLRVSGTIPVKQEILNDLLQTVLTDMANPKPATSAAATTPAPPSSSIDPRSLVKFVKKAEIQAEAGRLVLYVDLAIDGPEQ